jgi:hypothetical protein
MKPYLVAAGVPEGQIRMACGNHKIKTCIAAFDWLHNIYMSKEYKALVFAWDLLPPIVWNRYKMFELQGMREQLILESAVGPVLKLWRDKRPRIFGKDKPLPETLDMDTCRE